MRGSCKLVWRRRARSRISGMSRAFPSLSYTNGWIMALWICSYMVVPLTTMALMGKRINQVARLAGSVTVPDVLRDRFNSPGLGILSTLFILGFLIVNLVAQFKAGGLVMREALRLPPAAATYNGYHIEEKDKNLVLAFTLADGSTDVQRTPLPHIKAKVLTIKDDPNSREVLVTFELPEAQSTI